MISTGELRKGVTIELDGKLYSILDYEHIKMGRGSAQVRMKLRDVRAGHTIERTFQAGERFPVPGWSAAPFSTSMKRTVCTTSWTRKPTSRHRCPKTSWSTR